MRVLLVPNARGWSYDFTALALARELRDRFDIKIAYGSTEAQEHADSADVIVDFWWRGGLEQQYGRRVIKQVSSHRWQRHKYGKMPPALVAQRHLALAGAVVVPSERLRAIISDGIAGIAPLLSVAIAPKGFDPGLFSPPDRKHGPLVFGWCGNARSPDKRLKMLVLACGDLHIVGPGSERGAVPYDEMPAFYRSIDVITCASDAEGDPRPLIEGMASGCFPVVVDVGIVPELVRHGENGLIVEQSAGAFHAAFQWCRENADLVRAAGRRNAEEMLRSRTWAACAPSWGDAFDRVIARQREAAA